MKPFPERLIDRIESRGWKGRIVPIAHLDDLRQAICDRQERGLFDETLFKGHFTSFSYDLTADLPSACSIIIVAVPTPQMRVVFQRHGTPVPAVIPPTYVSYTPRTESVQAELASWLERDGYRLAKPRLPLKTLAARSGLADYGRSNITYVPGRGSFLHLVGAFTDPPCEDDPWREPKALDRCESCVACVKRCPTGAITTDRFLIHAERCLTYHNEAARDFPEWIDPSWHHCLVGCMQCQTVCPENKAHVNWFEDRVEFTETETDLMIRRTPFDRLPAETVAKWKSLEINEPYEQLCRNLSAIL